MDWNSATTKKHIKEAKAVGLTLIGAGRNKDYRTYRFNKCKHEQEITMANVRSNTFRCRECLQIQLETEAKVAGLTLLGLGRNSKDRTYRFNKCKHEQLIQMNDVRIDKFRCNQCFQIKLESEAKAVGLTLIGAGRNKDYRTYRFNKCKHEQEIRTAHVRSNTFRCHECLQKKLESEAKAVGLTLIGTGRSAAYRTYRFNNSKKCKRKHEQEIATTMVRNNNFKCNQCLQIKLENEAKAVGLTLIGDGKSRNYRTYRFNKCQHEQEITITSVRVNSFICNQCEETSRDLPSNVYLLKIKHKDNEWIKLGYAKSIKTRIQQYQLPKRTIVKRCKVIKFETGREAHEFEASLHKKYIRKRLTIKKMKEFHQRDGANECYPMKMLDTLMDELESKSTQ